MSIKRPFTSACYKPTRHTHHSLCKKINNLVSEIISCVRFSLSLSILPFSLLYYFSLRSIFFYSSLVILFVILITVIWHNIEIIYSHRRHQPQYIYICPSFYACTVFPENEKPSRCFACFYLG